MTKKPSLRKDSLTEMKSFAATSPAAAFSPEVHSGNPYHRRNGPDPRPISPAFSDASNRPSYSQGFGAIPPIPKADYSAPRPPIVHRNVEDYGFRKDKEPRKAIRTPSGRSFTATEYLKSYKPGQVPVQEEGKNFFKCSVQFLAGQRWWCSGQSVCLRSQRTEIRIQSSPKIFLL